MAITRIKNNQITDGTIDAAAKVLTKSVTSGKLEDNLNYGSNLTVTGNLTVSGTTTTINTTNTSVEDPILVLGALQTGAPALDFGFIGERGTGTNIAFIWNESLQEFVAGFTAAAESSTTISVTSYADVHMNAITTEATSTFAGIATSTLSTSGLATLNSASVTTTLDTATLSTSGAATLNSASVTTALDTATLSTSGLATLNSATVTTSLDTATLNTSGLATLASASVTGNITGGTVTSTGALTASSTLDVTGATTLNSTTTIAGGVGESFIITDGTAPVLTVDTTNGNLTTSGTLNAGNTTITGTLSTTGLATLDSVTVTNALTAGSFTSTGALSGAGVTDTTLTPTHVVFAGTGGALSGTASLTWGTGTLAVTGALTVSAATTLGSLDVTNATTLNSNVTLVGGLGESFIINDGTATTFSVDSTNGNTAISGTATVGSTLGVTGEATLASATVSDLTNTRLVLAGVAGSLTDSALLTFDGTNFAVGASYQVAAATGNTTVGGTLGVTGATTLGATTTGDFTVGATSVIDMGGNVVTNGATPLLTTDLATKGYVDGLSNSGWVISDGIVTQTIAGGDTLTIAGTANEVDVAVSAIDTLTIGLPNNVTVAGTLTSTGALAASSSATVGTTLDVSGNTTLTTVTTGNVTTTGINTITGSLVIDGVNGLTVTGNNISSNSGTTSIVIDPFPAGGDAGGDVIVYGNLQVMGTQTTVNSTTVSIADPITTLGTNTVLDALDRGTEWLYNDGLAKTAFLGLDNSAAELVYMSDATNTAGVMAGTLGAAAFGSMRVTDLTSTRIVYTAANGELVDSANLTFDGTTVTAGGLATAGALAAGNTAITGTLSTSGLATLDSASVTNNMTAGSVTSTGLLQANGAVNVVGVTTLSSLLNANGGISVDGVFTVADITGNVATTGTLDAGNTAITGTLSSTGAATLNSASVTNALSVGTNLTVTGTSTLNDTVTLVGGVGQSFIINDGTTANFTVDSSTGNTTIVGTLDVTGATTLGATTTGNFTVLGTSTVDMGGNVVTNGATPIATTDLATKGYVDGIASGGWDISDGVTTQTISSGDTLNLVGTANEVDVVVSAIDTLTIGLPNDINVAGILTVTGNTVMSTASTSGLATLASASVTGNITAGSATSTGAIIGQSTLDLTGAATLNSNVTLVGGTGETFIINDGTTTRFSVDSTNGDTIVGGTLTSGALTATSITDSALTNTRVTFAGAAGVLTDSASLTFDGTTLAASNISTSGTLGVTGTSTLGTTNITGVATVTGSAVIDNLTINASGIEASTGTEVVVNDTAAATKFRVASIANQNMLFVDGTNSSVNVGTGTSVTDVTLNVSATDSVMLAKGTTAQRPAIGVSGMMRYNTTTESYEYFDGTFNAWNAFGTEFTVIVSEILTGNGVATAFTLASAQTTASCIVSLNGVIQTPTSAYGVVGTTLTFTEAPLATDVIEVREITTTTSVTSLDPSLLINGGAY